MSLEADLKRALRAEDPGDAFTARVLARVRADAPHVPTSIADSAAPAGDVVPPPIAIAPRRPRMRGWWAAAVAASLMLTAGGTQWIRHRQEVVQGERARAEVLAALRLTSAKLAQVRAAVASSEEAR